MRVPRGRHMPVVGVAIAAAIVWTPTVIAQHYASGTGGVEISPLRPDRGFEFVYHAVRESRGARLGTREAALRQAREVWAGPPAVAREVRLRYLDGPFPVPRTPGGAEPRRDDWVVTPRGRLAWLVSGSVRGGPSQVIGVMDYRSGRVDWDIRPLPEGPR